ncbi:hypothetical protein SARC_00441 [Sphaeroforma arctica JP610]|uniref:Exocyst complex component n=1 Tax=Sphaeroforma arctica JP610 TaxID=667725 RepID=A0A0L0GF04_9EUKA|nr:hypothetical protein SARC_00441 [Sphaeroforma arctica JP610]KNC87459.1 hypothetical protein SARC_00441 [Sphaeroforma arctica JP610]|eukprot:XP_014161361.1 hypothetical protein SARC_00441 [Sphaeroforma arctica JP610]
MADVRPEVMGLSPSFGYDTGGSTITIRGMNFGVDADDLTGLTICGVDHLHKVRWDSSYKLVVTTAKVRLDDFPHAERGADGLRILSGPVLVSTAMGGQSQPSLMFKFIEEEEEEVDSETEMDEWKDVPDRRLRDGPDSALRTAVVIETVSDPLCIYKDEKKSKGKFKENVLIAETAVDPPILASLRETYPLGTSDPASANFVPAWFFAEKHANTPLHLLMVGSENLDALIVKQEHAVTSLMKDNFDRYVACQDVILTMQQVLERERDETGGDLTKGLQDNQQIVSTMASDYIKPLLARRDRAEAIRSVIGVLNRYKFLVGLPHAMRLAITNGQYLIAVTEYEKALSLYGHSEVDFVQQVLGEVETIADDLRTTLLDKLRQPRASMADRELYIDYLLRLGSTEDPSWMVIGYVRDGLCLMLNTCAMRYHAIPENEETIQRGTELFESVEFEGFVVKEHEWTSQGALRIISYISELSRIVSTLFPRLWKIYKMYCETCLAGLDKSQPEKGIGMGSQSNMSSGWKGLKSPSTASGMSMSQSESKSSLALDRKDTQSDASGAAVGSIIHVEEAIGPVFVLYEKLISNAFGLNHDKDSESGADEESPFADILFDCDHETSQALLKCATVISTFFKQLGDLEGLQTDAKKYVRMFTKMLKAYRAFCVRPVLQETHEEVHKLIDWKLTVSVGVSVTELPDELNVIIQACIDDLAPVLMEKSHRVKNEPSNTVVIVRDKIASLLHDFTEILRHHAFLKDPSANSKRGQQSLYQNMSLDLLAFESHPPSRSQRLLIVLGSINYLIDITIPMLGQMFEKKFMCSLIAMLQQPLRKLKLLALDINDDYVRTNTERLIAIIDEGVKDDSLLQKKPCGIRQFVKDVILGLVTVHSEVTSIDRSYCRTMIEGLQDNIADGICIIIDGMEITLQQYQQIHMDLKILSIAMGSYNTTRSKSLMKDAFRLLKGKVTECKPYAVPDEIEILAKFEQQMTFTLMCLEG